MPRTPIRRKGFAFVPCAGTREAPCSKRRGFVVPVRARLKDGLDNPPEGAAVVLFGEDRYALVCSVCLRFYEAEVEAQQAAEAAAEAAKNDVCVNCGCPRSSHAPVEAPDYKSFCRDRARCGCSGFYFPGGAS